MVELGDPLRAGEVVLSGAIGPMVNVNAGDELVARFEGFGEVRQARPAARFQLTESEIRSPAPKLGQHSADILTSLGFDQEAIGELIEAKTISQTA